MYLVDGRRYEPDEHGIERALAEAHDDRIRPLCLCCDPAIPVYIARLGVAFVLKRMPFTGSQHAVGCTHYEPPAELSGLGEVLGTAISEDPDTGVTQLRVGFALSKGGPRSIDAAADHDSGSVRSDGVRLSLGGLLHFLWHDADLTRWLPGFAGRRSWGVIRSHLLSAAANKTVRGVPLLDSLYVPEVFRVANRVEIDGRRMRRFANGLRRHGRARPLMLLIGEVKEIVPTRYHFKMVVKHMPDQTLVLDRQLHRRMVRKFNSELSLWDASNRIRMIVIMTFALNDAGLPTIEELSLMPTTPHWLPVEDGFELQLIDRLVDEGRAFEKSLGFNEKREPNSTSAILLDVQPSPIALGLDRTFGESSDSRGAASTVGLPPQWLWQVHRSALPSLPS
jgi:hypothetical protein